MKLRKVITRQAAMNLLKSIQNNYNHHYHLETEENWFYIKTPYCEYELYEGEDNQFAMVYFGKWVNLNKGMDLPMVLRTFDWQGSTIESDLISNTYSWEEYNALRAANDYIVCQEN